MALVLNNEVHRESGYWTKQVHQFLHFLREQGFTQAPEPLGFDEQGREIVSFVKGQTCDYPLSDEVASLEALVSAAKLLRTYHNVSQSFLNEITTTNQTWMLSCRDPQEVICHSDFAPYNICFEGKQAVGIIDFETAHPGPRVWDIVYALYRFAPFSNPKNIESFGGIEDQILRAYLFCNAYGLNEESRIGLVDLMLERLQALLSFLMQSAREGNKKYVLNMQAGHHLTYLADIEYITLHKLRIEKGLIKI
ncbi:aminoglycoside phosphotransferase family protein [Candidatus Berkiella cookevillensis]|uniref:Aminoglycoside phosphotransferase family protein n=1 Tax=Candidatus Berkiella cookevillensis TaxID=437022 RepID=A0A0Q9Y9S9_9GAMM|nr:aminoglycoside phosphotransferase family protein [Candidatus Berkiella cookevillensis]MCS5707983.1 aminoglycoside phosphotransferase family protein [Candidatus Berkiella cookevillensis]